MNRNDETAPSDQQPPRWLIWCCWATAIASLGFVIASGSLLIAVAAAVSWLLASREITKSLMIRNLGELGALISGVLLIVSGTAPALSAVTYLLAIFARSLLYATARGGVARMLAK